MLEHSDKNVIRLITYIDLLQVTDKLYHILLYKIYQVDLTMSWNKSHNVSGDRH